MRGARRCPHSFAPPDGGRPRMRPKIRRTSGVGDRAADSNSSARHIRRMTHRLCPTTTISSAHFAPRAIGARADSITSSSQVVRPTQPRTSPATGDLDRSEARATVASARKDASAAARCNSRPRRQTEWSVTRITSANRANATRPAAPIERIRVRPKPRRAKMRNSAPLTNRDDQQSARGCAHHGSARSIG